MGKETTRSNSSLAKVKVWAVSGNYAKGRQGHKIKKITLHHMAGVLTAKECGRIFQAKGRKCSAHYGVGSDGKIGIYVDENNIAYSDGNWASNCESISIEVANSKRGGQWPVSKKSIDLTIKLVADIAKRRNLGKLVAGKNLTWHSMYASTACPGPYLKSQIKYIAQEANKLNGYGTSTTKTTTTTSKTTSSKSFKVQVKIEDLNIRSGPGTSYKSKGFIKPGVYTIIQTNGKWGKLKSGAGWIHLDYAKKL